VHFRSPKDATDGGIATGYQDLTLRDNLDIVANMQLGHEPRGAVPAKPAGCLICQTLVDPAFTRPAKFVGPVYDEPTARDLAAARGWTVRADGAAWRRVVPSPEPAEVLELPLIRCPRSRA
jgi:carbamate kinase